jgi:Na+/proline symporter
LISYFTSRKIEKKSYFDGDKESPWYVVAFGMLGDSLSGVTFISVPGAILLAKFGYLQLVFGYFFGYLITEVFNQFFFVTYFNKCYMF